jgi:hypothetical protein
MLIPTGSPAAPRRISKMENGRRNIGSSPACGRNMTNWPGRAEAAIAGADILTTL